MASRITFDIAAFRAAYPAFADDLLYPDVMLQSYWDAAICYISDEDYGRLRGDCRERALWLMVAHLATIAGMIAAGNTPGLATSASVGNVSVSMTPPPNKTQFQWWLSLTGYGQQLYALLMAKSVGGFYIGGLPEGTAFRKWGGLF